VHASWGSCDYRHGVEFIVADDHAGLRAAIHEVLPEAAYQRCHVHFLRNALDHLPKNTSTTACRSCAGSLTAEISLRAKTDLAAWLSKWSGRYERLNNWVEETIEETFTYYRLPRQHQATDLCR
jgi:putative transposase